MFLLQNRGGARQAPRLNALSTDVKFCLETSPLPAASNEVVALAADVAVEGPTKMGSEGSVFCWSRLSVEEPGI